LASPANASKSAAEVLFFTDERDTSKGQVYFDKNGAGTIGMSWPVVVVMLVSWLMVFGF
jgi:hypothetical protein